MPVVRRLFGVLLTISIITAAGTPRGYNLPRPLEELVEQRERQAASPASVLLLPEIAALWDTDDPEAVLEAIEAAADDRRPPAWVSAYARWVLGGLMTRQGRLDETRQIVDELGFIQQWVFVGPFDNGNEAGFDRAYPPEEALTDELDLAATYSGQSHEVGWRDYPSPAHPAGLTSLGSLLSPAEDGCAYLVTTVEARRRTRAALRIGADGALAAWLNGVEVYRDSGNRNAVPDRDAAGIVLRRGRNRLVLKSCITRSGWDLFVRLSQPDGRPLSGVTVSADREHVTAAPPRGADPFEVPSLWSWFWEQAGGEPSDDAETEAEGDSEAGDEAEADEEAETPDIPAQAWADLARFLVSFGGDDPSEHRALDAAEAAVTAEATVDNLLQLARLHPDRNQRLAALHRARALDPQRLEVLMALAGEVGNGHHPEDAVAWLDRAEQVDPDNRHITLARADVLSAFGMNLSALARLQPLGEDQSARGRVLGAIRSLAHDVGNAELEHEMVRRYLEQHQSTLMVRIALAESLADQGELEEATELLRRGLEFDPLSATLRVELATMLEAQGELERALTLRQEAIELRPQDGRLHEELAHFYDRQGRTQQAEAAARRSLRLRPENPWLRQWLSVVSRQERFEENYIEEPETFLARRGAGEGHDSRTLFDLQVRKVYPSGQSDEFRQLVFEAVTLQGARNLAHYQVAYTPHRQRLRIERARVHRPDGTTREAVGRSTRDIYDPSIRMYYDLRATTVSFGDLQPGDVVEIRYRISDVGDANELGDYFGEMTLFQGATPTAHAAYVLLAPRDRELNFNIPEMEGLNHRVAQRGEEVEHLFEVSDVEPVTRERGMPPLAEVAPALLVSTFQSWQELGQWYWSLVRDQLELDATLRRQADEEVTGLSGDMAKVRAIHEYVVQSVRYVALEFGVHRFKPYRVVDIARRGFGDCKDQASLMIAMLDHVGVEAEMVLLRTRRRGQIEHDPPSLEVFDHAIVYVPSLELYIDPTAERVAVGELPAADQGVMALRVSEQEVTLTTTPLLPAQQQTRQLDLDLQLAPDGTASGRLEMRTTGWVAGMSRSALDDPGGRVNYLERLLSRYMRGVRVSNVATSDLTELDSDADVTMDLEVPGFARAEGQGLSFPVSIAPALTGVVSLPERQQDLVFGPPMGWIEELEITLPQGTQPAALPAPVEIETPMATFRLEITHSAGGPVRISSSLLWRAERVTPQEYGQLRDLVERVTAARTARVRVVTP